MGFFAAAVKKAFPPKKPFKPYTWPKLSKTVKVTKLQPTQIVPHTGSPVVPLAVKVVTATALVTTYVFVKAAWTRVAIKKTMPPRPAQLPHSTQLKPGVTPTKPWKGRREFDPYGDFAFHIEIGDMKMAFSKFDGVDVEIDQIEYKDSLDTHPHKRPGIHRYGNLKFSKGVIANRELWDWMHKCMAGDVERKNGSIHVLSEDHNKDKPEITYNFYQAWPCKWSGMRLDGKGTGVIVEELELVVDSIERAKS